MVEEGTPPDRHPGAIRQGHLKGRQELAIQCFAELLAYLHEEDVMPWRVISIGDAERDLSALEWNRLRIVAFEDAPRDAQQWRRLRDDQGEPDAAGSDGVVVEMEGVQSPGSRIALKYARYSNRNAAIAQEASTLAALSRKTDAVPGYYGRQQAAANQGVAPVGVLAVGERLVVSGEATLEYFAHVMSSTKELHKAGYLNRDQRPDNHLLPRTGRLRVLQADLSRAEAFVDRHGAQPPFVGRNSQQEMQKVSAQLCQYRRLVKAIRDLVDQCLLAMIFTRQVVVSALRDFSLFMIKLTRAADPIFNEPEREGTLSEHIRLVSSEFCVWLPNLLVLHHMTCRDTDYSDTLLQEVAPNLMRRKAATLARLMRNYDHMRAMFASNLNIDVNEFLGRVVSRLCDGDQRWREGLDAQHEQLLDDFYQIVLPLATVVALEDRAKFNTIAKFVASMLNDRINPHGPAAAAAAAAATGATGGGPPSGGPPPHGPHRLTRVMTVSFHKYDGKFFPGTGDLTNVD
ncbi:unnamed protein product [Vitrella brassicaformis CCMP3155]|uniref:Protein kinase domain-containing protein n=1 Tax=Vitrella brassicaformis (strain CCMP3155) TaxID=1169540 RepID=A0A0G4ECB3_VITBC|nr:unnamed protein product [Vitrella brassicaformis CCMP3155]|eukprot:CEL93347.1 unnamed protein product [Vitrella brassicaformis CCMP3155]